MGVVVVIDAQPLERPPETDRAQAVLVRDHALVVRKRQTVLVLEALLEPIICTLALRRHHSPPSGILSLRLEDIPKVKPAWALLPT
jgi:hypothetical protein